MQPEGLRLVIRRSKNDQQGEGALLPVNRTGRLTCPFNAYSECVAAAGITKGAVFRGVDRHGRLGERLSGQAVALIVQCRARAVQHLLRAGFPTTAEHKPGREESLAPLPSEGHGTTGQDKNLI